MASPQTEDGYTRIANELLEQLCRIRVNGEARQVLDCIFRKTYGYQKKEDAISLSQFTLSTGLKKPTIVKALAKLRSMNLITQKDNAIANIYSINKDFSSWKPLPKKVTEPKKIIIVTQKDNNRNPKRYPQKKVTKETITKESAATSRKKERVHNPLAREVLKAFENVDVKNKNYIKNNTQLYACDFLIATYGLEEVLKRISFLPRSNTMAYFPKIYSPYDLQEKWQALQDKVDEYKQTSKQAANKNKIWV